MRPLSKAAATAFALLLLVAAWQAVVQIGHYDRSLLPSPLHVAQGIVELARSGVLFEDLQVSLLRFAAGYFSASVCAILLGLTLGRIRPLWTLADPIVQVLRPVSPIAWSPFIVLWFGIGNAPAIVIIFLAAFFPVLLSTVKAVRSVDATYLKVAQNFELPPLRLLTRIVFPSAFPQIAHGLHLAIGTSWIFLVSGEMVGSQSGLGFLIVDSRNVLRLDLVMAGIVLIGVFGLLLDRTVGLLERWVGRQWGMEK
ncbi:sulfonate ABC transporter permease [Cohnella xylanilytica]|uniref:ABC transporter permease n=1 Tax=Cohnella xylanilytica TaxID=557555 RepID=UPI001AFF87BF|nr:ABC transporter permease [Cohnella xylanilytica]GIO16601.1 sulfonate ABC transporter permease [Cohnella xylanilytica]